MKYILISLLLLLTCTTYAQLLFPEFLEGTWKNENKESYEHWNKITNNHLKGFAYELKDGKMVVTEYLEIGKKANKIIYIATVLNQNKGESIEFTLQESDTAFVFTNHQHDFPNNIIYKKKSDSEVQVQVKDKNDQGYSFKMVKQNLKPEQQDSTVSNPNYDKLLAEKLGADDYGMKSYILVILKTGTNQSTDKDFISEKFRGHLDNIGRLVEQNKLIVAGPLGKNDNQYRGIFILNNVSSIEEANELLKTDPAIAAGLLDVELYNWYGSAALPEYLEYSDKVWKVKP